MTQTGAVTLQINVAPVDLPHAAHILPHQLRQWGGQVQEILFTFDLHRTARGGHFGEGWEERRAPMRELLEDLCAIIPGARIAEVDYAPEKMARAGGRLHRRVADPREGHEGRTVLPVLLRPARGAQRSRISPRLRSHVRRLAARCWIDEARRCCWPITPTCSPAARSRARRPPTERCAGRQRAAIRAQLARLSVQDAEHSPVPHRPRGACARGCCRCACSGRRARSAAPRRGCTAIRPTERPSW